MNTETQISDKLDQVIDLIFDKSSDFLDLKPNGLLITREKQITMLTNLSLEMAVGVKLAFTIGEDSNSYVRLFDEDNLPTNDTEAFKMSVVKMLLMLLKVSILSGLTARSMTMRLSKESSDATFFHIWFSFQALLAQELLNYRTAENTFSLERLQQGLLSAWSDIMHIFLHYQTELPTERIMEVININTEE